MICLCIGRKEQGKTTLGYHLARRFPTRVIVDPRDYFSTSPHVRLDASTLYEDLDDLSEVIIKPDDHVPENFALTCDELRDWLRDNRDEPFSFLVDEAYDVKTPDFMPPSLDWLLRKTKRNQGRIIFTVHRPSDISTDIRALSDHWFIFQMTQEHDLRVVTERCGSEVAEAVRTLAAREFINWNDGLATWTKHTNASEWYVSLAPFGQVHSPIERRTSRDTASIQG
jgi:hypothetical protein